MVATWPDEDALRTMTDEELVATYVRAAEASAAFENPAAQNAAADCVAGVYRLLRTRGSESQSLLLPLLSHPNIKVRQWAAAHALEFEPTAGERALTEIAGGERPLFAFEAKITLREWRAGRLRFP